MIRPFIQIGLASCLLATLCGLGCTTPVGGAEQEHQSESVGSVSSAFTDGYWWYTWNGGNTSVATGLSASSWTCFLRGIDGDLQGDYDTYYGNTSPSVQMYVSGGDWYFSIDNQGNGSDLGGSAMCVPAAPIITAQYYTTGEGTVNLTAASTNVVCGVSGVIGGIYWNSSDEDITWANNGTSGGTSGDSMYAYNTGTEWQIRGSGNAAGWVSCTTASTGYWHWNYYYGDGNWNLLDENVDTVQCFMEGVGGNFQNDSYSNGAQVAYNSSTTEWSANPTGGQSVWTMCVE